ncbi:hypothetical protein JOM56_000031, partial [Amanita muscaria]
MPQEQRHEHGKSRLSTPSSQVISEVSSTVLKALDAVAKYFPVPGIAQAASLALRISDTVQKANFNQVAFSRLADDAAQLVYVIFCTYKDITKEEDVDPNLKTNLDDVLKVLLDIQELANHSTSRGKIVGLLRSNADEDKIKECRRRLQHCLTKFGFESDLTIRLMVTKLTAQNERMMEMLEKRRNENGSGDNDRRGNIDGHDDQDQGHDAPNKGDRFQKPGVAQESASIAITIGSDTNFSGASGIAIGSNNQVN